jgi:hypothetical protein
MAGKLDRIICPHVRKSDKSMKVKLSEDMNLFPHEGMNGMGMIPALNECDGMHVYGRTERIGGEWAFAIFPLPETLG